MYMNEIDTCLWMNFMLVMILYEHDLELIEMNYEHDFG